MILNFETEIIASDVSFETLLLFEKFPSSFFFWLQFQKRLANLPTNEELEKTETKLKELCSNMVRDVENVILTMESDYLDHIYYIKSEIEESRLESEQKKGPNGCNLFSSLEEIAKNHQEVIERDKKLKRMEGALSLPCYWPFEMEKVMKKVLDDLKLSYSKFKTKQMYVPTVLEKLFEAVDRDDLKTFRHLMENENLPPNAASFIFNYSYPVNNTQWMLGKLCVSDKLAHLASIRGSSKILDYIAYKDFDLNVLDNQGNPVTSYVGMWNSKFMEDPYIKLWKMNWIKNCSKVDSNVALVAAAKCDLPKYCKFLIEEKGANVNWKLNSTKNSLQEAITYNRNVVFQELFVHSPDFSIRNSFNQNCLHLACDRNFHEIIDDLLQKEPKMMEEKDQSHLTPMEICIKNDYLESFQIMSKYFTNKDDMIAKALSLAKEKKATKIQQWLESEPKIIPT